MSLTIKDIARMAGVSISTVSKCINNYHDIGDETRQKVLAIMEQTGFKPSFSARSLISKRTHMIGVIFGHKVNYDFGHPHYTEVLNSFKKAIGRLGYDILLFSNEMFQTQGEDYLARCRHYKVDGCLIFAANDVLGAVKTLDESDIPCVGIDLTLKGNHSASVKVDNVLIGKLAAEHLLENGHRQIGYIGSHYAKPIYKYREQGFRSALEQAGVPIHENWMLYADNQLEQGGYDTAKKLLSAVPRPTALFAGADLLAIGAIHAIKEMGLSIPEQISVIGCDNIEACRHLDPPLTSVNQNKEIIGNQAAETLHRLILNNTAAEPSESLAQSLAIQFIEPDVIRRQTVKNMR